MRRERLAIRLDGIVQGVGFRSFAYRLAGSCGVDGWIRSSSRGADLQIEGPPHATGLFVHRLQRECPPAARILRLECHCIPTDGAEGFTVRANRHPSRRSMLVPNDIAVCDACLGEIQDPTSRHYRYPFTTCAHCGPRYSIIRELPYERKSTTMAAFPMCEECRREFDDPAGRRFRAEAIACPACGPRLALWDSSGTSLCGDEEALSEAAALLRRGGLLAVKGIGGFHLVVDATRPQAVAEIRHRLCRPDEPFALLVAGTDEAARICRVDPGETQLLRSPAAPIVLLQRRQDASGHFLAPESDAAAIADAVAPGQRTLGVMLPSTPLDALLLAAVGAPLALATGTPADEPRCTKKMEALQRLRSLADAFLVHDRPIAHPVADSVARSFRREAILLRRARGYAPARIDLGVAAVDSMVALGGGDANTMAVGIDGDALLAPFHGNLEKPPAREEWSASLSWIFKSSKRRPRLAIHDMQPGMATAGEARRIAAEAGSLPLSVCHGLAHVAACMTEHRLQGTTLGVVWDGSRAEEDGLMGGGEFLVTNLATVVRVARLRPFPLPGEATQLPQPSHAALGLLFELRGPEVLENEYWCRRLALPRSEWRRLGSSLRSGDAPRTTSVARLLDGVTAFLGGSAPVTYAAHATHRLEFLIGSAEALPNPWTLEKPRAAPDKTLLLDWGPVIEMLLADYDCGSPVSRLASSFLAALARSVVDVAEELGESTVVLTGDCFQNTRLLAECVERLERADIRPFWHRMLPTDDGGIAIGQLAVAAACASGASEAGNPICRRPPGAARP